MPWADSCAFSVSHVRITSRPPLRKAPPRVRSSASSAMRARTASIAPRPCHLPSVHRRDAALRAVLRPHQGDPLTYLHSIRAAIASVAPDQPISNGAFNGTFTLNEAIDRDARCIRSGAPAARSIPPFVVRCRVTVGLFRRSGGARSSTAGFRARETEQQRHNRGSLLRITSRIGTYVSSPPRLVQIR